MSIIVSSGPGVDYPSDNVLTLQRALNRFASIMETSKIKEDGYAGDQTFKRLLEVIAGFIPDQVPNYFPYTLSPDKPGYVTGESWNKAKLVEISLIAATTVNDQANKMGLTGTKADPPLTDAEKLEVRENQRAVGAPLSFDPWYLNTWLWAGVFVAAAGVIGYRVWKNHGSRR